MGGTLGFTQYRLFVELVADLDYSGSSNFFPTLRTPPLVPLSLSYWGMNGLFGKLSTIELRAQQGVCAASCQTYQCYKGESTLGEGQETGGCPVYSHPAQLPDNRNCVLCMTCLKACPHRSVEVNLRPSAIDLWTSHEATANDHPCREYSCQFDS